MPFLGRFAFVVDELALALLVFCLFSFLAATSVNVVFCALLVLVSFLIALFF